MRLQEIMNPNVVTIPPAETAENAWSRMRLRGIRHLVVVDRGDVVGVLSDRDLGGPRGSALRRGRAVADLMSRNVIGATPETTVRQAANLLRGHVISCLPVIEDGKLRGVLTISDLLNLIGRGTERPVRNPKRWVMKDRGPRHRPGRRQR
jgi:acetoin utilization protein AcuB